MIARPHLRIIATAAIALALVSVPALFPDFLVYQFSVALTYAIAILGLNLLMGFNGQISVAQGVFFAIGGYTTAILATRYGANVFATLPIAVATASLLGLAVGVPALRWQGLPLAFITFGLAVLVPPLALKLEAITKGATGISMAKPAPPAWFPGNQDTMLYLCCLAGLALCVMIAARLTRGDTGRSLRAVRDNGLIAESLGINLAKVRLATFVTCSGMAGFAGGLFAIVNGFVSPESFQMTKSFDFLVGAIVGGITSISGALIGALFVMFLPDWAADMNIALSGLIYGAVLIAMMLLARDGVVGLIRTLATGLGAYLAQRNAHEQPEDRQSRQFQT
ncbi:MAG TPA: branched-chain amino acid ABC transporter permease [Xanthobacteraceae bacterium]|nr:branched-chain amino acid ABC transporter permease [Xanthobacteraceae bacterium]